MLPMQEIIGLLNLGNIKVTSIELDPNNWTDF